MNFLFTRINDVLRKELPTNNTGAEATLSVGESLVLVINVCEKQNIDKSLLMELKRLYLEGTKNDEEREFIKEMTQVFLDKHFSVQSDPKTISEDPIRRYFETNLAYFILQNKAESLAHAQLEQFTQNLQQRLFSLPEFNHEKRIKVECILKGNMDKNLLNKYELEYAELIHKLLTQNYYGLSEKACKNLYQIASSTILATLNTQIDKSMPIDIYSDSIFTMGMDGRGRIIKEGQDEVRTTAKGLMKSTSPLPMYHDVVNPVEEHYKQEEFSPFQRSVDQADFMIESGWCQHLFSRQTQPYSNGISSTTLALIRNIILQKRLGNPYFNDNFKEYLSIFSSLMIYNSGGHSFFEIFEVLKLSFCKELLDTNVELFNALEDDSLMYKVLYLDHQQEFEFALQETQRFTQILLNKKLLNAQIKKKNEGDMELISRPLTHAKLESIHHAVLNFSAGELVKVLEKHLEDVDIPNQKGWSPLMVASQLGKTEHVRVLLKAGANIKKKVGGFSPLELAIKGEKFDTVKVLLNAGAPVKQRSISKGSIKKRAPALYLACRQNDMRILNAMMSKGNWNIEDKTDAILVALQIENLDAVKVLMQSLTSKEKQTYFSARYKFLLLKEAVALGNVQLIDQLVKLDILPSSTVHYNELFQASVTLGFLPVTKYLLDLAQSIQKPQLPMDMNAALTVELENNRFETAVLLIIYGADPESIPTSAKYLQAFNAYLQHAQHFDFLFTEKDVEKIKARANCINSAVTNRHNNKFHGFLKNLIEFMNRILPNSWRLGYNDKIDVINNIAQVLDIKKSSLHKSGIFAPSSRSDSMKKSDNQRSTGNKDETTEQHKPKP
ncbi:ankyrin repeat domain-containing protein [Legionella worsleiensis]|uniref:Ankyrin repeats (3 copies) n=1 Tax=Legionella worsleiensis TaxID=45076 RepID=A0A0W1AFY0_9GAMM|nr:ankyrin repeat domain-containing protein [Legionella worsleiensis]KTD80230.1 Ankyrin repeats (3 copies) [Legionella worsleiensis]STY31685.1 Ribulose-5-phosphate 4-epimerase and related epimerases and aldolases [Legionella worsleiensis]